MRLAALLQITLMIFFGAPELRGRFNVRHDGPIESTALGERNEFRIALSGGNTPRPVYARLAAIGRGLP